MSVKFLNDVVQPWDELNRFLAGRYALQPDVSRVTRLAGALAVSIKHQADMEGARRLAPLVGLDDKQRRRHVDGESRANQLMSDVADAFKHGTLRETSRNNRLRVEASFEFDEENRFRFLRNQIVISHTTFGEVDFMPAAALAIRYWLDKLDIQIRWNDHVAEGPMKFYQTAFLYYHPEHQIALNSIKLSFQKRAADGTLVRTYPPEIVFAVYDELQAGRATRAGWVERSENQRFAVRGVLAERSPPLNVIPAQAGIQSSFRNLDRCRNSPRGAHCVL